MILAVYDSGMYNTHIIESDKIVACLLWEN